MLEVTGRIAGVRGAGEAAMRSTPFTPIAPIAASVALRFQAPIICSQSSPHQGTGAEWCVESRLSRPGAHPKAPLAAFKTTALQRADRDSAVEALNKLHEAAGQLGG